jgi:membrane carboxypeptidase/penicillin-binding protein
MKAALSAGRPRPFTVPTENIVFVDIDKQTGLRAGPSCPKAISEAFIAGTEPMERCFSH